jgi:hypothetical protein
MVRTPFYTLIVCFIAAGCAPQTNSNNLPPAQDLSAVQHDLGPDCSDTGTNLLINPSFEMNSSGSANNTGNPASTIASWNGCCSGGGGTTWQITQLVSHCGKNSISVQSTNATTNVLVQGLNMSGDAGMTFHLSGWLFVSQIGTGGQILLDVFDLTKNAVVASTVALSATTSDWFQLAQSGTVPTGGNFQVRINNSGTIQQAYVDDVSLTIP